MSTRSISTSYVKRARNLTIAYALSLLMAFFMAIAAVVGLLYQTTIYPTDELLLSFVPSDVFNLAVGLPLLLGSVWLARQGKLAGLLSWPGMLFYVLYMYIPYLIGVPFNVLFVPYVLLVVLSAYTLIGIVSNINGEAVRQALSGFVPVRASAGILIALAILVTVRQTALIVTALIEQTPVDTLESAVWIADYTVAIPALLVGGIQLWRRKALGYVTGAGLLLGYGLLALGLILFFVMQARYTAAPIDAAGIVTILVMAGFCFIPLAFFLRGAVSGRGSSPARSEGAWRSSSV